MEDITTPVIIFTRPLCHDCQLVKEALGIEGTDVRQETDLATVFLLPTTNQPNNDEEVDAYTELDCWVEEHFTYPVAVRTADRAVFQGKDAILAALCEEEDHGKT